MKTEILRMQNVCIGDEMARFALKDFHLQVYQGEMINLLGVSGAGKTALYLYFTGEEILSSGRVIYNNQIWNEREHFTAIKDVICIGQKSTLISNLSIAENLCIITGRRKIKGIINKKRMNDRINFLLRQFAPDLMAEMPVKELSMVQRHIVELLRAIENEVRLIFIDDAFSSYGHIDLQRISEFIKILKEKNIAVLYASRKKDLLTNLAERIIVLRNGKNVKTFYHDDYDDDLCLKWLIGNPNISSYKRNVYKTSDIILSLNHVSGPTYIKDLNLDIHKGEVVGLYDLNNSANREVLDLLIGNEKNTHGQILYMGNRYSPKNIDDVIKANIGYIPKDRTKSGVVGSMSFSENLLLPIMLKMSLFSFFKNNRVNRFLEQEYIEEIGIQLKDKDKDVECFDSYVKTNVIFRKWILANPKLMICEDVCEETDIEMRNIIYKSIEELAKNQTAVLVVSSNLGELKAICDTLYIMNSYGNGEQIKEVLQIQLK